MTQLAYSAAGAIAGAALLGTVAFASPLCAASLNLTQAPAVGPAQATSTSTNLLILVKASSGDRVETRITELHAKLKITPAQESLWTNVTQVMRENAAKMDALTKARSEHAKTMSAVDDLKSYGEIADVHADNLKSFIPVFGALYDSMSEAQKVNADAMFRRHVHTASKSN